MLARGSGAAPSLWTQGRKTQSEDARADPRGYGVVVLGKDEEERRGGGGGGARMGGGGGVQRDFTKHDVVCARCHKTLLWHRATSPVCTDFRKRVVLPIYLEGETLPRRGMARWGP